MAATNGTPAVVTDIKTKQEPMEVVDVVVDAVNGINKESAEDGPEPPKSPGMFKLKVSGLPKFYPLGEFKKLVKEELGLALSYVRSPKRGNPWLHLTFATEEEQQKALKALDQYAWRKKVLSCIVLAADTNGKRKPEESAGDDNDAKKAKLDMTVEERVLMVTIPLHNVPYEDQLKKKMDELKALVLRLGDLLVRRNPVLGGWVEQQREKYDGLPFKLDEILPSPVVDAYRNKCELRAGLNPDTQERTVGCRLEYFKEGKIGVGPADSFKHLPQQIREAVKIFQDYIRASDKAPFVVEKNEGYWRHLVVRLTSNGDLMVVVVLHPQELTPEDLEKVKEDLKDFYLNREGKACNVASLYFQQFTEKLVGVPLPQLENLFGKTHLEETLLGITFHLSPSSYFQVNTKGAEVLYKAIIDMVDPTEETTVLDLCCGTGGIGLCIANKCGQVFGIEYLVQNIEDAKLNAEKNGITNCEFIAGRVEDILPTLEEKITGKSIVPILDPPRTGLNQKVLCQLRKMENVKKMVYICSNHKAPIRNFLDLCCPDGKSNMVGNPFVPTRTIPVDVAPHTLHAQMVILMERIDPSTLPKAKNPLPRLIPRKTARGRGAQLRGRGPRIRGVMPPRGMFRGRGMHAPPLLAMRGGFMGMPQRGPPMPMRPMRRPVPPMRRPAPPMRPVRPRPLDGYDEGYGPAPLLGRSRDYGDYVPRGMPQRQRLDFSSDELTLSRYSDFRRDVEDAIDSSYAAPRPMPSYHRSPRDPYAQSSAAMDMLEREEMAYQAGLSRGLVGSTRYSAPPSRNMSYSPFAGGRGKPAPLGFSQRGIKRGGTRPARRGRGGRR